jgi:hypothetical protein
LGIPFPLWISEWEPKGEAGSPLPVFHRDRSSELLFHDRFDHVESDTGSFLFLGAEVGFEDPLEVLRGDAAGVVAESDAVLRPLPFRRDEDLRLGDPAFRQGVPGVGDEVEEDLGDLG